MPVLGFGAVTLGREIGADASYALLDRAYELGFRIVDTAESYGGGDARAARLRTLGIDDVREASDLMHSSEILLGRWARSRGIRKTVQIHTKVSTNYSPEGIRQALQRSLDRLQTDYVDGYYLHSAPAHLSDAVSTLADLRRSGCVHRIGICNVSVGTLETAHAVGALDLCQNVFNLAQAEQERELIPWCHAQGVDFVAYSPLGAGFLTGKYGSRGELSPKGTRFDIIPGHGDVYFRPECFDALDRLNLVAEDSGIPHHQLALGWVLQRTDIAVVLVGATRPEHLENAVAVANSPIHGSVLARLQLPRVAQSSR
jgi:aryl-alcohol dehydrogenase-like predicted oxidoreductase